MTRHTTLRPLAAALLLAALLLPMDRADAGKAAKAEVDLVALEREATQRINDHRKASKLAPFSQNDQIAAIARRHSEDMAKGAVRFGHDGLNDRVAQASKRMQVAAMAENVSRHQRSSDFAEAAVSKWLASPVHRTNIDGDYGLTGVGAARSDEGVVYFTQLFVKVRSD